MRGFQLCRFLGKGVPCSVRQSRHKSCLIVSPDDPHHMVSIFGNESQVRAVGREDRNTAKKMLHQEL